MNNPKISIIMPVYNSERYLRESINSILNQTLKDFEFIIIDDCSIDNSLAIIKKYKDKRINLVCNKENIGSLFSRNIGLKIAKGKYVAILDSDDISIKDRLQLQYDYLEKHKHIFLVGSSAIYVNEKGCEIQRFRKYNDYRMLAWRLPKSNSIVHSSILFRNTKKYFYNKKYETSEDYDLYLRLLRDGKHLTNLPDFLVKYRVHSESISSKYNLKQKRYLSRIKLHNQFKGKFRLRFLPKLFIHYFKTYNEKRGK